MATQGRNWTRRLANVLVALVVIAVAGATFVFSYAGVHAIALLGGVSAQLARYYPGLFDAVLVIACVAAVTLRDGRWWARLWAWLVMIIVLGAIGTADVLHAMDYTLRHRPTEGIIAAAPVVAVLLAFSLLLTMLRQTRAQAPSVPVATPAGVPALPAVASAPPIALPAAPTGDVIPHAFDSLAVAAATPTVPVPVPGAEAAPPTVPVPVPDGGPVSEEAPVLDDVTAEDAESWDVLPWPDDEDAALEAAVLQEAPTPTQPNEVMPAGTATVAPAGLPDQPEPPTVGGPAATRVPVPPRSRDIRYANGDRNASPRADYWETEDSAQFAGLVYRARDDDDDDNNGDGDGDAPRDDPAARLDPLEFDDDAPPFATAPFVSVPRLNRVRAMPTPPADEDADD